MVSTVTVGGGAFGVAYDSGKGEIFVTNAGDSTVSVISDLVRLLLQAPTSSPSATSTVTASPTPTVPEFSSIALVSMAAAMVVVTSYAVAIGRKKSQKIDSKLS